MDFKAKTTEEETAEMCLALYTKEKKVHYWRSLLSFWIFGLSNDFSYFVILTAAYDLLQTNEESSGYSTIQKTKATMNSNNTMSPQTTLSFNTSFKQPLNASQDRELMCNPISTGVLLLASLPSALFGRGAFPFFSEKLPYALKVFIIVSIMTVSFLLVSLYHEDVHVSIVGMVIAYLGKIIGDITFLGLTTFYHRNVVSTWSSGTGGSGLFSAFSYVGLTSLGLSLPVILLVMLVVPTTMVFTYIFVLGKPHRNFGSIEAAVDDSALLVDQTRRKNVNSLTLKQKVCLLPCLLKYMAPLSTISFLQYFINQGLHELLYFNDFFLSKNEQYRWYQLTYYLSTFIGRSSVNIYHVKDVWFLPVLQLSNLCLLLSQVFFRYLPNFWIVLLIIFWEGLLGGTAYVNTFFKLTNEVQEDEKEFAIGLVTVGYSIGISLAGVVAISVQRAICNMHLKIV